MISVSKPLVQSSEIEVKAESGAYRRTNYIESGEKDAPLAFAIQYEPGRVSSTHYHTADQFQVVIEGGGTIGRHVVRPLAVHFSRAYTPYGPLIANSTAEEMTFLTTGVVRIVQPPKQNSACRDLTTAGSIRISPAPPVDQNCTSNVNLRNIPGYGLKQTLQHNCDEEDS